MLPVRKRVVAIHCVYLSQDRGCCFLAGSSVGPFDSSGKESVDLCLDCTIFSVADSKAMMMNRRRRRPTKAHTISPSKTKHEPKENLPPSRNRRPASQARRSSQEFSQAQQRTTKPNSGSTVQ